MKLNPEWKDISDEWNKDFSVVPLLRNDID